MRIMACLFNKGRAPADIMPIMNGKYDELKEIFSDINRNDPLSVWKRNEIQKMPWQNQIKSE